jgi:glycosyltransferase involved in cell wall biosynthesis
MERSAVFRINKKNYAKLILISYCNLFKNQKFSIIVACLNTRAAICSTLDNLSAQSYDDFEIIVINDGSTDGTTTFLYAYNKLITRLIIQSGKSIYDAWSKGLEITRGDQIGFLGAGDVYLPNSLHLYAKYIADKPNLECVSGLVEVYDDLGRTRIVGKPWDWAFFRLHMCVTHVVSLYARTLFEKFGRFDPNYRVSGDYELLLRA